MRFNQSPSASPRRSSPYDEKYCEWIIDITGNAVPGEEQEASTVSKNLFGGFALRVELFLTYNLFFAGPNVHVARFVCSYVV